MSVAYEQRLCEFCGTASDVETPRALDDAGWTETFDVDGWLERCPSCSMYPAMEPHEPSEFCASGCRHTRRSA